MASDQQEWLKRKVQSVGKGCFERDRDIYEAYRNGEICHSRAVDKIVRRGRIDKPGEPLTQQGAEMKFRFAMEIYDAGLQGEALQL